MKLNLFNGASHRDVDKRVQEDIGDYIIPTGHAVAPVAPNVLLEARVPKEGANVAKR